MDSKKIKHKLLKGITTSLLASALFLNPANARVVITPVNSQKEYTITIDRPYETVFEAFQEIMPRERAYFASLQAKEANNWYSWLPVGEHKVMINEGRLNEDFEKAISKQKEYLLDWRVDSSRKKESLEDAINRVTGFNGKLLFFALEELRADKGTLDLQPGNHTLYFDIKNLEERLKSHYSEVFGREVSPEDYAPPKSSRKIVEGYVTKYYTPRQSDFNSWSAFRSAVAIQGSGILNDGRMLRYNGKILDLGDGFSNGVTSAGTNPIPLGTLSAPPEVKLGTLVYVRFGGIHPCNGWYRAEDRGSAIKGEHFDFYVGVGKESLYREGRYIKGKKNVTIYFP